MHWLLTKREPSEGISGASCFVTDSSGMSEKYSAKIDESCRVDMLPPRELGSPSVERPEMSAGTGAACTSRTNESAARATTWKRMVELRAVRLE